MIYFCRNKQQRPNANVPCLPEKGWESYKYNSTTNHSHSTEMFQNAFNIRKAMVRA